MTTKISINCPPMFVRHIGRGLQETDELLATWQADGPDGKALTGNITFPKTLVREESLVLWWVDAVDASNSFVMMSFAGQTIDDGYKIISRLPKERCDFVLRCPGCGSDWIDNEQRCGQCRRGGPFMPHVIARTILAPTTITIPEWVGEVWQPQTSPFKSTGRYETDTIKPLSPFVSQQGILYPDVNSWLRGIGLWQVDTCVATGEVRWSK